MYRCIVCQKEVHITYCGLCEHCRDPVVILRLRKELYVIEQILGRALGYPRYCDDQINFPGATDDDGVCTGDNTALSLADEAAQRIRKVNNEGT